MPSEAEIHRFAQRLAHYGPSITLDQLYYEVHREAILVAARAHPDLVPSMLDCAKAIGFAQAPLCAGKLQPYLMEDEDMLTEWYRGAHGGLPQR